MAFSVQSLRRVLSTSSTTRGFCGSADHRDDFYSHLQHLKNTLSPAVLPLKTFFLSPTGTRHTSLLATGVFLEPNLIATSAAAVGRFATSYEPLTVIKPDRFQHGRILHKPDIGITVALTVDGKALETKPLAVSFDNDLAVLKVAKPEGGFFPHCALSRSAPCEGDILWSISHRPNSGSEILLGKVRATGERTVRAKSPWPLDDRSEWIEHDWVVFDGDGGGKPNPPLYNCRGKKLAGFITKIAGSPWFNIQSQVVGIASWQVGDETSFVKVGFTVPSPVIRSVLDYAKTKGPGDPLVMDSWVSARSS